MFGMLKVVVGLTNIIAVVSFCRCSSQGKKVF